MNYTIDTHVQRQKVLDEKGNPIITKDAGGKTMAQVKETPGFIVRADDAFVVFVKTRKEAIAIIEKEQKTPSILPGMTLTIENHTKREKIFNKDGTPVMENGRVKENLTPGFNLRNENKVIAFRETRAELVKMIKNVSGIEDDKAAEESVKPKKTPPKRERKTGR